MLEKTTRLQDQHISRLQIALEYIDAHLDGELNLVIVAKAALCSPYYFHRLFKVMTKESLHVYITRRRIEKAAVVLLYQPEVRVSSLAYQYGFSSNAAFTKAFKKFYRVSPTAFRKQHPNRYAKVNTNESKNGQVAPAFEEYLSNITNLNNWIAMNAQITIKELPEFNLAYMTAIGESNLTTTYEQLLAWAGPKGLLNQPDLRLLTIYHNSYKITAPDKVRMSACLVLNESITADGAIGLTSIAAGKCIVGRFEIKPEAFEQAWSGLFIWMNEQGHTKADREPFEIYYNDFRTHPEQKYIVDLCIPIE